MAGHSRPKDGVASLAYVPAIHALLQLAMGKGGYIYILSNRPDGVLYLGVTNDLIRRVFEHREGVVKGFQKLTISNGSSIMNNTMIFGSPFSAKRR